MRHQRGIRVRWLVAVAAAASGLCCHNIFPYSPGTADRRAADLPFDGPRERPGVDTTSRDLRPMDAPSAPDGAPGAMVTTIAGTGSCGQMCGPHELHLASNGTLYIASIWSYRICAIPPPVLAGKIVDFAGTGQGGYNEGSLAAAQFKQPNGITSLDASRILVADTGNHRIRLLDLAIGSTKSYAGTGQPGLKDDAASQAQFSSPTSIAVLGTDVYVVDEGNYLIRKIADGVVSTFAGNGAPGVADGPLLSASFNFPHSITYDDTSAAFYVTECSASVVRKIAGGQVTTFAGSTIGHSDGPLLQAKFDCPGGIVAHKGALFIGDYGNQRVRMIKGGQVTTLAGSGVTGHANGPALSAQFSGPDGVAYDAAAGTLYVSDNDGVYIRAITGVFP